jgi:hypothetical protein
MLFGCNTALCPIVSRDPARLRFSSSPPGRRTLNDAIDKIESGKGYFLFKIIAERLSYFRLQLFRKKYLKTEEDRRNYFYAARVASLSGHVD